MSDAEARAVATQVAVWLSRSGACSELQGPDRIVNAEAGWSVVAVVNGVELWIDVRPAPNQEGDVKVHGLDPVVAAAYGRAFA